MYDPVKEVIITKHASYASIPGNPATGVICSLPYCDLIGFIKKHLTEWNYDVRTKRYMPGYRYVYWDKNRGRLNVPINLLDELISYLDSKRVGYSINKANPVNPHRFKFDINNSLTLRADQIDPVKYITNDEAITSIEVGCGKGKTFMSITAIARLGHRALVVVPAFLHKQWVTNITALFGENQTMFNIQGFDSLRKLNEDKSLYGKDGPMIILASSKTLSKYAMGIDKYKELPPFETFLSRMKFGVKIIDEIHLGFYANTMIDLRSNIKKNIYLSATYKRTSKSSDKIFAKIFPSHNRFIDEDTDRYVNITEAIYSVGGEINPHFISTSRGYSQYKYEQWVMKYPDRIRRIVDGIIGRVVDDFYMKIADPDEKLLIIVGLTDFAKLIVQKFTERYPHLIVQTFISSDKEEVLTESDIIVSTIGSMGTGKDVANLRSVVTFSSIASEPQNLQMLGRLRKLKENTPEYIYLVNAGIEAHKRHASVRQSLYMKKAKKFNRITI